MFSGSSSRTPGPPRSTRRTSSPATTTTSRANPPPSTTPPGPLARPSSSTVSPSPNPKAAGQVPSHRRGNQRSCCPAVPDAASTAEVITVGTNGPGATARPMASATTTSSGSPYPDPPTASGRCSPSQPMSTSRSQNGGMRSSAASSRARLAVRAPTDARSAVATPSSSRCSSLIAVPTIGYP